MINSDIKLGKCETCDTNEAVGVCAIPGMPISVAYCRSCLEANAHPWDYLIAQAACLQQPWALHAASYFVQMVMDTCKVLGKTREEFDNEVAIASELLEELSEKNNG